MDEPKQKPRFRPYFGLSQLLLLTAGLAIGMAAMQPWRTWEPDPTEVSYDVKVVRVKTPENLSAAENAKLLTDLANIYTPNKTVFVRPASNMELLGASTLTAMTRSDAAFELANASPGEGAVKLDSVQVKLRPHLNQGNIDSMIEAHLSWQPIPPSAQNTTQWTSTAFCTKPGATEVIEVHLGPKSPQGKDGQRYFVIVTPSLPPTFAWVASSPGAKHVLRKRN